MPIYTNPRTGDRYYSEDPRDIFQPAPVGGFSFDIGILSLPGLFGPRGGATRPRPPRRIPIDRAPRPPPRRPVPPAPPLPGVFPLPDVTVSAPRIPTLPEISVHGRMTDEERRRRDELAEIDAWCERNPVLCQPGEAIPGAGESNPAFDFLWDQLEGEGASMDARLERARRAELEGEHIERELPNVAQLAGSGPLGSPEGFVQTLPWWARILGQVAARAIARRILRRPKEPPPKKPPEPILQPVIPIFWPLPGPEEEILPGKYGDILPDVVGRPAVLPEVVVSPSGAPAPGPGRAPAPSPVPMPTVEPVRVPSPGPLRVPAPAPIGQPGPSPAPGRAPRPARSPFPTPGRLPSVLPFLPLAPLLGAGAAPGLAPLRSPFPTGSPAPGPGVAPQPSPLTGFNPGMGRCICPSATEQRAARRRRKRKGCYRRQKVPCKLQRK